MKKVTYFILTFLLVVGFGFLIKNYKGKMGLSLQYILHPPEILVKRPEPEVWINIFVHGTFGTALGLLSIPKVAKDEVKGSWYHEILKDMRKDKKFYTEQVILGKGLIKLKPTFDASEVGDKKLAAYPIIKAFDEVIKITNPNQANNYYTFGWTGLMSQKRRRVEALRFYNELCEEYEKYENAGIKPKIRILAHSHGGNLCLNLAAINHIVREINDLRTINTNVQKNEVLVELFELIKTLPSKDVAKSKDKMKKFDYLPSNKNIKVQEIFLLGVPIQPETEGFCKYDFFEKIYNIYSTKDYIQQIDFISTKQGFSSQRISPEIVQNQNKIVQARIMISRSMKKERAGKVKTEPEDGNSFLGKVMSSVQTYFADDSQDPTHKDLWFTTWGRENDVFTAPLPMVVFLPLVSKALGRAIDKDRDFDVNLKKAKKSNLLKVQISKYNKFKVAVEEIFPIEIIDKIRNGFKNWKPREYEEKDAKLAFIFDDIKTKLEMFQKLYSLCEVKKT